MVNKNKFILILGAGLTGKSFATYFSKINLPFVIYDGNLENQENFKKENKDIIFLKEEDIDFKNISSIACSPGFSLNHSVIKKAKKNKIPIESDIKYFLENNASKKILVTGTNGKTSVCLWLEEILIKSGFNAKAIGNLGLPVLAYINEPKEFYIIEVSSFQLDICNLPSFDVSLILNLSPDHLDRHGSMKKYIEAKRKIMSSSGVSIINSKNKDIFPNASIYFSGEGNIQIQNKSAIKQVLTSIGVEFKEEIFSSLKNHSHRLERFYESSDGITFINDSKATNIDASISGMESLPSDQALVVICGGQSKGVNMQPLFRYLRKRAKFVAAIGESADCFFENLGSEICFRAKDLESGVKACLSKISSGDILLLSPGCSSLDMFSGFEERGNKFKELILNEKSK